MINLDTVGSKDKEKTIKAIPHKIQKMVFVRCCLKSLLKLYRTILHIVNNGLVLLDDEMYVTSRKHFSDIIERLMLFETKKTNKISMTRYQSIIPTLKFCIFSKMFV